MIKNMLISGYRSFELNVFKDDDPKIAVVKNCLKLTLIPLIEEGTEWFLVGGQLGVETWGAEVVLELKSLYPNIKLALITAHEGFGNNWKEEKREKLLQIKNQADYVNSTSHHSYENPNQLRNHQAFMLNHTEGAVLVYDVEYPGKTQYLHKEILRLKEQENYELVSIDFDMLQNSYQD